MGQQQRRCRVSKHHHTLKKDGEVERGHPNSRGWILVLDPSPKCGPQSQGFGSSHCTWPEDQQRLRLRAAKASLPPAPKPPVLVPRSRERTRQVTTAAAGPAPPWGSTKGRLQKSSPTPRPPGSSCLGRHTLDQPNRIGLHPCVYSMHQHISWLLLGNHRTLCAQQRVCLGDPNPIPKPGAGEGIFLSHLLIFNSSKMEDFDEVKLRKHGKLCRHRNRQNEGFDGHSPKGPHLYKKGVCRRRWCWRPLLGGLLWPVGYPCCRHLRPHWDLI